jgi:hypothetical protein
MRVSSAAHSELSVSYTPEEGKHLTGNDAFHTRYQNGALTLR